MRKKSILDGRFVQLLMLNGEFERIKEKRIDVYEHDGACYVIPTVSVEKRPLMPVADLLGFNYNYYITLCFLRYQCRIGFGRRKNDEKS